MATKIRLARGGVRKRPYYRIVVSDVRSPRDSNYIEVIGSYNPLLSSDNPQRVQIKTERWQYWSGVGAQPTERVALLAKKMGLA